jgi:hypothetical protein
MAQYADCYLLVDSRSIKVGMKFLDKFLPNRKESSVDYPVPLYADEPQEIFTNAADLMQFLEVESTEDYMVYWKNTENKNVIKHGMIFYTDDGKMIIGFSVEGRNPDDEPVVQSFNEVKSYLNLEIGCITIEEEPPTNSIEFKSFCAQRYIP